MTNPERQKSLEHLYKTVNGVNPGDCGWCKYCSAQIIDLRVDTDSFICCATEEERIKYNLCAKPYNTHVRKG